MKNLRKVLAALLAASSLLVLTACNGGGGNAGTPETSAPNTSAPAAPASTPDGGNAGEGYTGESATFIIHTTANEGTTNAKALDVFCDRVEELTEGKVTFTRYYAGTLCTQPETLDYLSTGALDIAFMGTNLYSAVLPLVGFPGTIYASEEMGGSQYAVDYGNYMILDNEETSKLILDEAAVNNVTYLGVIASGANTFVSVNPINTLGDLNSLRLGTAANYSAFESLGTTIIEVFPNNMYDSFQRGIIDCSEMSLSAAVRLMWYEVAKYYAMNNTFGWGQPITMNLEKWNACSPELQAIMYQAARETGAATAAMDDESIEASRATLKENGVELVQLPDEDCQKWGATLLNLAIADARELAKGQEYADNLETILKAATDYLGVELPAA